MAGLKSSLRQLCILAHSERETVSRYQHCSFTSSFKCLVPSTWPWGAYQRVRAPSTLQDPSSITPMAIAEEFQHVEFERVYSRIPTQLGWTRQPNGRLASLAVGQHHKDPVRMPKPHHKYLISPTS